MPSFRKPRILVIGSDEENTFEHELVEFLRLKSHLLECDVLPKVSPSLTEAAKAVDLILMYCQDRPAEKRLEDERVLPHLREVSGHLFLLAKDHNKLLDFINGIAMPIPRGLLPVTAKGDWRGQLLERIFQWREEHVGHEDDAPVEPGPAPAGLWGRFKKALNDSKEVVGALVLVVSGGVTLMKMIFPPTVAAHDAAPLYWLDAIEAKEAQVGSPTLARWAWLDKTVVKQRSKLSIAEDGEATLALQLGDSGGPLEFTGFLADEGKLERGKLVLTSYEGRRGDDKEYYPPGSKLAAEPSADGGIEISDQAGITYTLTSHGAD